MMPAQLTTTAISPNASFAFANSCLTSSGFEMSAATAIALPPAAVIFLTASSALSGLPSNEP